jgi:hypothetical protein
LPVQRDIAEHPKDSKRRGAENGLRVGNKAKKMAVKHVDLEDCYNPTSNNKDITVSVKIGDGQEGSYAIFLGTELVSVDSPGKLGKKGDVVGKNTIISVTIVDELEETNWTSITVNVKEGSEIKQFGPYRMQAENNNDTVIYTLKLVHQ